VDYLAKVCFHNETAKIFGALRGLELAFVEACKATELRHLVLPRLDFDFIVKIPLALFNLEHSFSVHKPRFWERTANKECEKSVKRDNRDNARYRIYGIPQKILPFKRYCEGVAKNYGYCAD
jgi:hypothetical protein